MGDGEADGRRQIAPCRFADDILWWQGRQLLAYHLHIPFIGRNEDIFCAILGQYAVYRQLQCRFRADYRLKLFG